MTNADTLETTSELLKYKGKADGIEYDFSAVILPKGKHDGYMYPTDTLQIKYVVSNTSNKNYVLFNRGHWGGDQSVWTSVEPLTNGTAEIAQKAFEEPKDKKCPERYMAILPKGSWLLTGKKIEGQTNVSLPLTVKTPFDDCSPKMEMPETLKGVRFCLGYAEADVKKVSIEKDNIIRRESQLNLGKQKFLCSNTVTLP